MKKHRIENFSRGWFVGDFSPTLLRSREMEVAMKTYMAGDREPAHVHEVAREFTVIASGRFRMNGQELVAGDIVDLHPGTVADFECLEGGVTLVVKSPSAPHDKKVVGQ